MKIATIVQARRASSRLPGKVLRDLLGVPIIKLVFNRCLEMTETVILVTTDRPEDDALVALACGMDVMVNRGEDGHVYDWFMSAMSKVDADAIIRVCGDSPFIDVGLAKGLIDGIVDDDTRAVCYGSPESPAILTEYGIFPELLTWRYFYEQNINEIPDHVQEHVTPPLYMHPGPNDVWLPMPDIGIEFKAAVDTWEDYEKLGDYVEHFGIPNNWRELRDNLIPHNILSCKEMVKDYEYLRYRRDRAESQRLR